IEDAIERITGWSVMAEGLVSAGGAPSDCEYFDEDSDAEVGVTFISLDDGVYLYLRQAMVDGDTSNICSIFDVVHECSLSGDGQARVFTRFGSDDSGAVAGGI